MTPQHQAFLQALSQHVPAERLITDPMRTLAYGTDASFYRLVPQIVVRAIDEAEVGHVLRLARTHHVPVTLRAAGTSLSGQAVSDSVLVLINDGWTGIEVQDGGQRIRLQPGVIGQHANDALRRFQRKIGPDPASINTARIGGISRVKDAEVAPIATKPISTGRLQAMACIRQAGMGAARALRAWPSGVRR